VVSPDRQTTEHAPARVLLEGAIDYAGLFPPAQLDMAAAVAEYASYLRSDEAWALGAFVAPAARLEELATVATGLRAPHGEPLGALTPWRVSAVVGADVRAEMGQVRVFHAAHATASAWPAAVRSVELRASTAEAIAEAARTVGDGFDLFVEIPIAGDVQPLVRAIGVANACAKVRTGGTAADMFPSSEDLARFLAACVRERVPFKATAGLHHALRGAYPLTYAPDSARGTMYGFLNVFLAAAFLRAGESEAMVRALLEEREAAALQFDQSGVAWRGHRLSTAQLESSRDGAIRSFGSCSFREPLDDLASLGLL
jgi:hypothetical protein